jgi:hypothetical protein
MFAARSYKNYGVSSDPFFNNTSLLLHGDGTNGAQNNTFLDSSSNNLTITRNGTPTQGSFTPYGNLWSNYFNGSTDYLNNYTAGAATATSFGTNDFTVEAWVNFNSATSNHGICDAVSGFYFWKSTTSLIFGLHGVGNIITYAWTPVAGTWHHVAVSRSGTSLKMFVNGAQVASVTNSTNFVSAGVNVGVVATPYYFNGYISNLRIVKGTAVYTSTFTPPTSPLTAIAETSLLTCQSNRFRDNSSNNLALTVNGNVSVSTEAPFNPTSEYSITTDGGSGYFNGTTDWLNVGTVGDTVFNFGLGPFTIEGWINPSASLSPTSYTAICGVHDGLTLTSWGIYARSNGIYIFGGNSAVGLFVGGGTISPNIWTHFAVTRSGNTVTVYINGIQVVQNTNVTGQYENAGDQFKIADDNGSALLFNGYISNLRIVKGAALYTSNFTLPTSPVTPTSNGGGGGTAPTSGQVSLLCDFTNAGIFDNTKKNNLVTVGNAQISTLVKKYGTGSMYFDGTGDYLTAPDNNNFSFGTGDFTVECWIYLNAINRLNGIWTNGPATTGAFGFYVLINNRLEAVFYNGGTLNSSTSLAANTWYHVAASRSSNTTRLFVNGTQEAIVTAAINNTTNKCSVGNSFTNLSDSLNGYLDDLRITKGVARYTANFTPPTQAFPNQ